MKRISGFKVFLILAAGVVLCGLLGSILPGPEPASADPELRSSDRHRVKFGSVVKEYAGTSKAWAVREVLPAVTSRKYIIDTIVCGISAAGSIYFGEDTDTVFPKTALTESDPFTSPSMNLMFSTGEGVDFYSNSNGGIALYIEYHLE